MKKNGKKLTNSDKLSMEQHQIKKFKTNLSYLVVVPVIGEELELETLKLPIFSGEELEYIYVSVI